MIKLIMIEAANFMSFETLKVSLEDVGLCLVGGRNLDENDSNGSGKTTILSAVTWALFGRTIDGLKADSVLSWQNPKDCYARIWLTAMNENVQVTRYRNWKDEGNKVEVTIQEDTHVGKPTEMQELINSLLGFDYDTLITTAVYTQTSAKLLAGATDSTRRAVFGKLLNLGRYERAHGIAKGKAKEARDICDGCRTAIEIKTIELKSLVATHERLGPLEAGYDNERVKKIQTIEREIEGLGSKLPVKALRAEIAQLDYDLDGIDLRAVERQVTEARINFNRYEEELDGKEKTYHELNDTKECRLCGRPYTEEDKESSREILQEFIKDVRRKKDEADQQYTTAKVLEADLRPRFDRRSAAGVELAGRCGRNDRREYERSHLEERLKEIQDADNPYTEEFSNCIRNLATTKTMLELLAQDLEDAKAEQHVSEMMESFYSNKGIQAFIIENSFGFIQEKANHYLSILTGGTTQIEVSPTKEIKGETKEEVTIGVLRGGSTVGYNNLSGGEQQRVAIALLFAINSFMRTQSGIDFLLLDEVLDLSLDETGQEALMALLGELANEVSSIFVISHKQFIKEHFNSHIEVEKKNGVSKII